MVADLLSRIRSNPRDWRIEDVVAVCRREGLACTPPRKGSHYKVRHEALTDILTIPAHRPIKPVYISELVKMIDATRGTAREPDGL